MKRSELLSRIFIMAAIIVVVAAPLVIWVRTPLIHAKVAENGGWNPDIIHATTGEPLTLYLTSDDVVHGFAVGQMDMQSVDVMPGKVTNVTLTFDKPGIYTFFCTRWCGLNHWRMRSTIEVSGSSSLVPQPAEPALSDTEGVPLYVTLGLDIDAPHDAPSTLGIHPSAFHGKQLAANLPIDESTDYYLTHSPYQVFGELNNTALTESQRWDVVAYIWQSNTTTEALAKGQKLFVQNCAACHGENGAGNGVFADQLRAAGETSKQNMTGDNKMSMQTPANFTDPKRILGASPALLQGKILRGGMGTGMPMWGSIFTKEQIWDLIAFLYSFQFEYHN
jgi:plastocyanin